MVRNGTYDNRSSRMREYWVDGQCYDCHPAEIVNASYLDRPDGTIKPFGSYPEVTWQPNCWVVPEEFDLRISRYVAIVDALMHRMIKSG